MQDFGIKILLNHAICGNLPPLKERGFAPVPATNLQEPDYQSQFFETLPTMWATAHIFQHALARKERAAIEEWVALLLLHSYKRVHLDQFAQRELQHQFDRDLWPALSGTYPNPQRSELTDLKILRTDDDVVVGAYYPGVIFFPARGRAAWPTDPHLLDCLDESGQRLSWARSSGLLLRSEAEQQRFHQRLYSITAKLEGPIRGALLEFLRQEPVFSQFRQPDQYEKLNDDPASWPSLGMVAPHHGDDEDEPSQLPPLLRSYPFKQTRNGGTTFYLLTGLPVQAEWMRSPIESGSPAPNQYERASDKQIRVRFGQDYTFTLGDRDEIVLLKDLFCVEASPYYCVLDKRVAEEQAASIRRLHKQEIANNTAFFTEVKPSDLAVCFAPIKSRFLEHFPEVMAEPERFLAVRGRTAEGGLEWEFNFYKQKLIWPTAPKPAKALPSASLAIWPPKVSPQWHLYVAHGTGAKRDSCGRWHLIGEKGQIGENFELAEDEYINVLNTPGQASRPRALTLRDSRENERGVLFFNAAKEDEQVSSGVPASLAIDFGTSNTSLAFKLDGAPTPLLFDLSPKMLWGARPLLENPGFVPFKWGGRKGYFPTILLKRQSASLEGIRAANLEPKHFFAVDIPGLHKDLEERIFDPALQANWPEIHKNLKWEDDPLMPWRRPAFLGLALLYAHAELFFNKGGALVKDYVFTFPLAFTDRQQEGFKEETQVVVNLIRQYCFGADAITPSYLDESTAIAKSVAAIGNKAAIEVFVDIGGGTTDIALRYDGSFLVLDSIKIAGKSFFAFAEQNFDPGLDVAAATEFKQHLGSLLLNRASDKDMEAMVSIVKNKNLELGNFYSLVINKLNDSEFRNKEAAILEKTMGWPSYQRYRTELFFSHIITYALLQACAVAADHKLDARTLSSGIKLILSGNGWGLMLFGELQRSKSELKGKCHDILDLLKERILRGYDEEIERASEEAVNDLRRERACLEHLRIFDIDLLNERNLSKAKTDVTVGALTNIAQRRVQNGEERPAPYAGVTLRHVSINNRDGMTIRWCDRWSFEELRRKAGPRERAIESLEIGAPESYETPLDHSLAVFTILGGTGSNDPMPPEEWHKMNSLLCSGDSYLEGRRLAHSPINQFVSKVLYPEDGQHLFLDVLARINKTMK